MDISQRLELLREHQKAWENLDFTSDFRTYLEWFIPFTWELQGGVLSQQTANHSMMFIRIPSKIRGIPRKEWTIENLGFQFRNYTFDPSQNLLVALEHVSYVNISIDRLQLPHLIYHF